MRQLLVVCSVILLLGTFSGCRTDPQDILLGTEESVTEEVSGEIPVLKSESENVKQTTPERRCLSMSAELSASPEFMNFQHRAVHTKQLPWRVACWKMPGLMLSIWLKC